LQNAEIRCVYKVSHSVSGNRKENYKSKYFFYNSGIAIRCTLKRIHKGTRRYIEKKIDVSFDASLLVLIMNFITTRVHSVWVMLKIFDAALKILPHTDM